MEPFISLPWPEWDVPPGHLSAHGCRLIEILGGWLGGQYLEELGGGDPPEQWAYIRADSLDRTVQTARHWLKGFLGVEEPGVTIHHLKVEEPKTVYDPVFLPIDGGMVEVGGVDEAVHGQICGDLWSTIESLRGPLALMQKALGGPVFSPEIYGKKNEILADGTITGTLELAQMASDIFVLQFANGWPIEKVAWGRINRSELLDIERARIFTDNLINRAPAYARAQASNLMAHIAAGMEQVVTGESVEAVPFGAETKLVGYFGHDTNIQTIGGLLRLSWLPESFVQDQAPPGCEQLFELRQDEESGEFFVRLYFVAATLDQMNQASPLSGANPPGFGPIAIPHVSGLGTSLDVPYDEFLRVVSRAIALEAVDGDLAEWFRSRG
jgi:4-phytase/acid phosphatase